MSQPIPVIPLEYERPIAPPRASRWLAALVAVAWTACAVAWGLLAFFHVETVIVTGPVIAALGIWLAAVGVRARQPSALVLGVADVAVCILFFTLVQVFNWSPRQAKWPFITMGGLYCLATAVVSFLLLFPANRRR